MPGHRHSYVCPYCKKLVKKLTDHLTRKAEGNRCVTMMEAEDLAPADVSARQRDRVARLGRQVITPEQMRAFRASTDPVATVLTHLGVPFFEHLVSTHNSNCTSLQLTGSSTFFSFPCVCKDLGFRWHSQLFICLSVCLSGS